MEIYQSTIEKIGENDEYRLTYGIEYLKQGKLSSHSDIDKTDKESDERNWIVIIHTNKYDERDQIEERK